MAAMSQAPASSFHDLVAWSESFLEAHGPDSPRGMGCLTGDADTRYRVMLEAIRDRRRPVTLLDFGCGLANLNDLIIREGIANVTYSGLDLSDRFLAESQRKYPATTFFKADVLTDQLDTIPSFDYVVMNGIFHYKGAQHDDAEMFAYLRALVARMFTRARVGLAFNMITRQVEWERDDLFHVPVDEVLTFLSYHVSRHVVVRHDYGLYEYTVYVYREPSDPDEADAQPLLRAGVGPDVAPAGMP
jgi:SAM-dependent methyltransferase